MQYITEILTTLIVFGSAALIIIAILNFILKMRIVNLGYKDEAWVKSLTTSIEYKYTSLKWALLLFFSGIGLVIVSVVPIEEPLKSPLTYGLLFICLSAGFFTYYLMVHKNRPES